MKLVKHRRSPFRVRRSARLRRWHLDASRGGDGARLGHFWAVRAAADRASAPRKRWRPRRLRASSSAARQLSHRPSCGASSGCVRGGCHFERSPRSWTERAGRPRRAAQLGTQRPCGASSPGRP